MRNKLEEGKEKKGGQNSPPLKPKPNFSPPPQKSRPYKGELENLYKNDCLKYCICGKAIYIHT